MLKAGLSLTVVYLKTQRGDRVLVEFLLTLACPANSISLNIHTLVVFYT